MQGRRFLTSLVKNIARPTSRYCPKCNPVPSVGPMIVDPCKRPSYLGQWPLDLDRPSSGQVIVDALQRPRDRPIVFETMEMIKILTPQEIKKYGFIFSELLGLPKPPEETKTIVGDKFAVKLVNYDKDRKIEVWCAVAWVVSKDAVVKSLSELSPVPVIKICENIPAVMKECVSKEEAEEMIAKVEAAGGVAVMEKLE